jgi:hypothetical protein
MLRSRLFQSVCRFFTKRFIPRDDEMKFAEALFEWKYNT